MKDILEDFKQNYFLDENNSGFVKEHYREQGLKENISFMFKQNELNENDVNECLEHIKQLLNNNKLVVCTLPIVRYETNVYSVDNDSTIEDINEHLNNKGTVLLYCPIKVDNVLMYKTRFL
jgi:Mn-containing catalase